MVPPVVRACLAVLVSLLLACGPGGTPRRDLVVVLADTSVGTGAAYLDRRADGMVLHGGLRRDETVLPTPLELRIELFTSRRDGAYLDRLHPVLPLLPSAANRSGRAALGFSTPEGLVPDIGFDEAFAVPGQPAARDLERLAAADVAPAVRAALDELATRSRERDVPRPPSFLMVDLAGAAPADLDALLDVLAPELEAAHLLLYFTDPASPDRMLLAGPGLPRGERNEPVDPRDLFPTAAILGRVPVPGPVQGRDLLRE